MPTGGRSTLTQFIIEERRRAPGATGELNALITNVALACKAIARRVAELLEDVCQQSPGRLFVVAPECPRAESVKLEWIADMVLVGHETFSYEVPELELSA